MLIAHIEGQSRFVAVTHRPAVESKSQLVAKLQKLVQELPRLENPLFLSRRPPYCRLACRKTIHRIPLQASGWNYFFGHRLIRLNITSRCSGDKHGCEKWLTEPRGIRYAQNQDKAGFFTNLMTVLSLSDLLGGVRATVSGSGERSLPRYRPADPRNGKTAT